ncbi:MAG: glycosyltransferase family 4 protein [Planctomycetales bacterium]|nr:glycosyltransferase family 4 protein [Planctomycetales bacterium]
MKSQKVRTLASSVPRIPWVQQGARRDDRRSGGQRILFFYQYFGTNEGCWSTRVHEFARGWVAAGDRVTVITSVYDKSDLKPDRWYWQRTIDGIDVRVFNIRLSNKHGSHWRLVTFILYSLLSCWIALTHPANVVVSSSGPLTVGLPGLVARYLRRKPFVFEVRDLWPDGAIQLQVLRNPVLIWLARRLESLCYRAASVVVALSEDTARHLRTEHRLTRVCVIPNIADNDLFGACDRLHANTLPAWAQEKNLVVYAGTLGLMDDCEQILHMAKRLQDRDEDRIQVVLIGDGKERRRLEEQADQLSLHNVRFIGPMPKRELVPWLQQATCALMCFRSVPVLNAVSPNKLYDALAAGTPLVQTTQGWIKQMLSRESCGITVPQDDPDAMANAVIQLVKNPELRATMSINGQRIARTIFDKGLLGAQYRDVIATITNEAFQ